MNILTTTQVRKNIKTIVDRVKYSGEVVGIGRRNSIDVLLVRMPGAQNKEFNEITNINAGSQSFDFLGNEPETYSVSDIKKRYA